MRNFRDDMELRVLRSNGGLTIPRVANGESGRHDGEHGTKTGEAQRGRRGDVRRRLAHRSAGGRAHDRWACRAAHDGPRRSLLDLSPADATAAWSLPGLRELAEHRPLNTYAVGSAIGARTQFELSLISSANSVRAPLCFVGES